MQVGPRMSEGVERRAAFDRFRRVAWIARTGWRTGELP